MAMRMSRSWMVIMMVDAPQHRSLGAVTSSEEPGTSSDEESSAWLTPAPNAPSSAPHGHSGSVRLTVRERPPMDWDPPRLGRRLLFPLLR